MRLKDLSLSQRLAAGCGCVGVLVVLVTLLGYAGMSLWASSRARDRVRTAPPGWVDSIRAMARIPDLTGLQLERTDSGDGAAAARALPPRRGIDHAYRAAIGLATATAEDSARWREVAADTTLEAVVRIARRREWRAVEASLAGRDSLARHNILLFPVPNISLARDAVRALVIRAMVRLDRRDRAGARSDLAAATSVGEQTFRHEPTMLGTLIGRTQLSSAARGWERYATRTGDSAVERKAAVVVRWASGIPGAYTGLLLAQPDSALALATDTTLALGPRGDALTQVVASRALTPRGFVFGMPGRELERLEALAASGDPEFRQLATIAAETARRLRFFGVLKLLREAGVRPE